MTDRKRPIDQAVELTVYAPLGLVLEARRLLPSLVDRGRSQVEMTKMIGRFAVTQGRGEAGKQLAKVQRRADEVLSEFGLREAEQAPTDAPAAEVAPPAVRRVTTQSGAEAEALAIPDYDSLAASQVIPRLESLSDDELAAVARYEAAHRARKTILGKITQLQGA